MIDKNASARELALHILGANARDKSYIDLAVKAGMSGSSLDRRDRALAARLCYGVVQNRMLLNHYIAQFSTIRLKRIHPVVLDILRLGFYQLIFTDKIPASAAVNTTVELTKKSGNVRASGFVNALMRRASSEKLVPPEGFTPEALSLKYSHPMWLVNYFINKIGAEETAELLSLNNTPAPTTARLNRLKADMDTLKAQLEKEHIGIRPHPFLDDCIFLDNTGDLEESAAFNEGLFTVQDAASQLCVLAADAKSSEFVIDACAAPGGKSFYLSQQMENQGTLFSCDIYDHKVDLIKDGAARLGVSNLTAMLQDAGEFNEKWNEKADLVLADLPCSGIGIIRKKPDIRYKNEDEVSKLPELQLRLLENLCRYVKPEGRLVYSTCTLMNEENEGVISLFLEKNPDFYPETFRLPGANAEVRDGMITLWPHIHGTDGFFICRMKRRSRTT